MKVTTAHVPVCLFRCQSLQAAGGPWSISGAQEASSHQGGFPIPVPSPNPAVGRGVELCGMQQCQDLLWISGAAAEAVRGHRDPCWGQGPSSPLSQPEAGEAAGAGPGWCLPAAASSACTCAVPVLGSGHVPSMGQLSGSGGVDAWAPCRRLLPSSSLLSGSCAVLAPRCRPCSDLRAAAGLGPSLSHIPPSRHGTCVGRAGCSCWLSLCPWL